ncbi:hypothetical protein [Knoellia subterranea]|uniref:Spheroidene monooxygenase n=1 Tax=Knoellia subterranea KCTC 19937 TaxID=1385521 RepID=A0A0A0JHV0_9MICO|nr:hypothetical protein [Knoellia subterranea]KGN36324.1 hypothetical protein N803_05840 [Knoellia subterranea KCTC 19937]
MGIHSFHLAEVPPTTAARVLVGHRNDPGTAGLQHIEHLSLMTLGAPAISLERLQLRRHAVFAQWESEAALDDYLAGDPVGQHLARGWHVRLEFVRRWGAVTGLHRLPLNADTMDDDEPVVAVTLAHLKLPQLARFFRWGRPVERLVRDHPGQTLALAAVRPPRTFSTFSVWESVSAMRDMVEGRGGGQAPERHARAMVEREREDFHSEFTTLRFRPLSEHGFWQGRNGIVPTP